MASAGNIQLPCSVRAVLKKMRTTFPKSQYGFSMGTAEICTHRAKIMLPMFFSVANPFPKSIGMWLCSSHGLVAIILHFRVLVPQFNTPEPCQVWGVHAHSHDKPPKPRHPDPVVFLLWWNLALNIYLDTPEPKCSCKGQCRLTRPTGHMPPHLIKQLVYYTS